MSLPLKVRVTIRDSWDSSSSDLKKSFEKVKELVGLPIWCEPEWGPLLEELKGAFDDQGQFVPTIANVVRAWAEALIEIAGDDVNEEWTEEMLGKVGTREIRVNLGVGKDRPTTFWNSTTKGFEICFPKKTDSARMLSSVMTAGFHRDLRQAFKPQHARSGSKSAAATAAPVVDYAEDSTWVDAAASDIDSASIVGITPATTDRHMHVSRSSIGGMPIRPAEDHLPNLSSIERPEELTRKPPYHLIMRWSESKVMIHGSHQPSLELIAEYLKKWSKRNHQLSNKPPVAQVELRGSCFGLGTMFDRIEIETQHRDMWNKIDPTIILCFIEGVLGYRLAFQEGFNWHFRREVGFR